jgi:hypothetical protein
VASAAKLGVVGRYVLVPLDEVRVVSRVVHPVRWFQSPLRELGLHAPIGTLQVAHRAFTRRVATSRFGHLVATEAPAHARQLITRRQLEVLYFAVALCAANVAFGVGPVGKAKVGRWDALPLDAARLLTAEPNVAEPALPKQAALGLYLLEIFVVGSVATVAALAGREQRVRALGAGLGPHVTLGTLHAQAHEVSAMIEANGQALLWKNDGAGATVTRKGARRSVLQRYLCPTRQGRKPVHQGRARCSRAGGWLGAR